MAHVLVTGGTGFLGAHTIARLLAEGHAVTTTVRSLSRRGDVASMLGTAGVADPAAVAYVEADLTRDAGWAEAVAGADHVLHLASPFPAGAPRHEDELIVPARDGALRVLRAARDAGVRRTVLTSSFGAVGYGHRAGGHVFTESDWTDLDGPGVSPYVKSKTVAERAAWDFAATEGGGMELTVVNPVGIFGPVLGPDYSSSVRIVHAMLSGGMRVAPPVWTNTVDVRDVADLHVRAMTAPVAAGRRYLASAGEPVSFHRIAAVLRERLGDAASAAPTRTAPAGLLRALAVVSPRMRELAPQLGVVRRADGTRARTELGWAPRGNEEAVVATAESLLRLGLVAR
ncbi:SDR family oxidoreductase [Kitasatospora fiedleri]|uniref:SDR family oxidoreductase n=1 Tax=Kitasatospora fiedleri TaxID=2991545 RepID=UPI00249A71C6|nr:aldehyde reductase [Kitasatospora fiedleri]